MADLQSLYNEHKNLSEDAQKQAGKAIAGTMSKENEAFLETLLSLLKKQEIEPANPQSFLNKKIYDKLSAQDKDKIDLALINLARLLEHIVQFRLSTKTPDSSPQLETMIAELLQMKSRIEEKVGDVFKF